MDNKIHIHRELSKKEFDALNIGQLILIDVPPGAIGIEQDPENFSRKFSLNEEALDRLGQAMAGNTAELYFRKRVIGKAEFQEMSPDQTPRRELDLPAPYGFYKVTEVYKKC